MDAISKKKKRRELARLKELKKQGLFAHGQAPGTPTQAEQKTTKTSPAEHHLHHTSTRSSGSFFAQLLQPIKSYYEHHYKKLLLIPLLILILAIGQIAFQVATTGDFIHKGISLKGGITVTVPEAAINLAQLEETLKTDFPEYETSLRTLTREGRASGFVLEADITDQQKIDESVRLLEKETGITRDRYTIESVGSSLGASFFKETLIALLIAFLFMAGVVFFYFRQPIPCLAVVLAAASDIIITIAVVNVIGLKVSTAGIAALLMLIGYSVDTDILLSTRVLKRREGTVLQAVYGSVKTGMTMMITTIAAVTVGLFVTESEVLRQIMLIVLIGLIVDPIMTWIQNAGLLRWYLEAQEKKKSSQSA